MEKRAKELLPVFLQSHLILIQALGPAHGFSRRRGRRGDCKGRVCPENHQLETGWRGRLERTYDTPWYGGRELRISFCHDEAKITLNCITISRCLPYIFLAYGRGGAGLFLFIYMSHLEATCLPPSDSPLSCYVTKLWKAQGRNGRWSLLSEDCRSREGGQPTEAQITFNTCPRDGLSQVLPKAPHPLQVEMNPKEAPMNVV